MAARKLGVKKIAAATAAPINAKNPAPVQERPKPGQKLTHSYRLFALLKKQKGTATTEQLAAAAGLKPFYVSWYMAELKRVYGVDYEHKRGEADYRVKNLEGIVVPPTGVAGKRRGQAATTLSNSEAKTYRADQLMEKALDAAHANIEREFARLKASLARVKVTQKQGEVRVASIPWDAWLQMKKELGANAPKVVASS